MEGKVDLDELDRKEKEREQLEKYRVESKVKAKRDRELKGRSGKGHKGNYKLFCKRCHIEWWVDDIDKCTQCGGDLMTEEVSSFLKMQIFLFFFPEK